MQTNFADTILNISVTGSLVRIDLGTLNPVQGTDGKLEQKPTVTQQLILPMEGFARSFSMQEQVVKQLIKDGVLKAQEPTDATTPIEALR